MKIKISKSDWMKVGSRMGWLKSAESSDIDAIASRMNFLPTRKKPLSYKPWKGDTESMPPMTYKVMEEGGRTDTSIGGELETTRSHSAGDVMMCGPKGERYTMTVKKFMKNYDGRLGDDVVVEQTPRMVARYEGEQPVRFTASWGEEMILKPGDYLVKEGEGQYYRIERGIFEDTYNKLGS